MKLKYNLRAIAAQTIAEVLDNGQSLNVILPASQAKVTDKDAALLQELCFGILRVMPELEWYIQQLMAKVMTGKQRILHYLLMVGIYQLVYTRIPPHAAVAETVNATQSLKRPQLKGLINGVMREFQRQQSQLTTQFPQTKQPSLHPDWLLKRLQHAYPDHWPTIIQANNRKPPMWLRVNRQYHTRDEYLALLHQVNLNATIAEESPDALCLDTAVPVTALPGFFQGWVTVQDLSAQECALYLQPQNGELILDLCAAPGGKTTHLLEIAPQAKVVAVDIDAQRLQRVRENLHRLQQTAEVVVGDGATPKNWCQGRQFDRILFDAPCSATGVIRRHPDIKWLRRDSDIAELAALQKKILEAIWPYLTPGGSLLYTTCSILPEENGQQIEQFLATHPDAKLILLAPDHPASKQNLPDDNAGDGFFYAKLTKLA